MKINITKGEGMTAREKIKMKAQGINQKGGRQKGKKTTKYGYNL